MGKDRAIRKRMKTLGDVLVQLDRWREALVAPLPRCPEGARRHAEREDARKTELVETIRLYGTFADE